MSATHYDTLGIEQGADAGEVRKAYRRAASAAHPDREGGSVEAMQRVNRAFEVLSDPERREAYDAAGCTEETDGMAPAHVEARELLRKLLAEGVQRDGAVLKYVRRQLAELHGHVTANRMQCQQRKDRLTKRRGTVRTTGDAENLVHAIVDAELQGIEQQLARLARMETVHDLTVALLAAYEEDTPEAAPSMSWCFDFAQGGDFTGVTRA